MRRSRPGPGRLSSSPACRCSRPGACCAPNNAAVPCAWHAGDTQKAQVAWKMECTTMKRLARRLRLPISCTLPPGSGASSVARRRYARADTSPTRDAPASHPAPAVVRCTSMPAIAAPRASKRGLRSSVPSVRPSRIQNLRHAMRQRGEIHLQQAQSTWKRSA